jgi:hypothetical protein
MANGSPAATPAKPAAKGGRWPLLAPRNPMHRSRVSNGREVLPNIDGRSVAARRIYDITSAIVTDLGGADGLSETRLSLVRRFASLATLAEEQEAKLARGEDVDVASLAHLSSTLCRLAQRIGLKRVARDVTPSLPEYLRSAEDSE